jgi:hypothetical protein
MKQSEKTVLVTLVAVYLFLSLALGSFNPIEWRRISVAPAPTQQQQQAPTAASGVFTIKVVGYDSLDIMATSPPALGTAYDAYFMALRSGGWLLLGKATSSAGGATIEVAPQDGGYVYAVVEVKSGQNYYVDFAETKLRNPRVVSVSYEDPDGDGYKEFIFKLSLADVPKPASGYPEVYFYPYLIAYSAPSLNTPSDITAGTSAVTEYIEWYATFSAEKKGFAISKIEFSINTTDTTKIQLKRMNVPGVGYLTSDQFGTPLRGTSSLTWTWTAGSSLQTAHYIKYGSNMLNKFDFTTMVDCTLQTSDVIACTITIYGFTPSGTLTTITDTVNITGS